MPVELRRGYNFFLANEYLLMFCVLAGFSDKNLCEILQIDQKSLSMVECDNEVMSACNAARCNAIKIT